jgi:hypothetical protein
VALVLTAAAVVESSTLIVTGSCAEVLMVRLGPGSLPLDRARELVVGAWRWGAISTRFCSRRRGQSKAREPVKRLICRGEAEPM